MKLKDIINETRQIPKIGDFFDMGSHYDFELVPIIRVNRKDKWIDIKHLKGHNHRIDFWNIKYGGIKGSNKIWRAN